MKLWVVLPRARCSQVGRLAGEMLRWLSSPPTQGSHVKSAEGISLGCYRKLEIEPSAAACGVLGGCKAVCGAMISDILCSQHGERRPWARSQCIPLSVQQCPIVSSFFRCLQAKDFLKLLEGNVFTLPEKQNKHDLGNALRSWPSINNSAVSPH